MDAIKEQKLLRLIEMYEQRLSDADIRITNLEAILNENFENLIITEINKLWLANEELNLRVLFTMQHFQFRKHVPTGMFDAANQPIMKEVRSTLYDIFEESREAFTAKVKANEAANATQQVDAAATGAAAGVSADAPPAGEKETTIVVPGDFRHTH